jgi:hypothetical protein
MNERIKELTEQAEIRFKKLYIPGTTYVHESPAEVTKESLQKFAELLIRECAVWMENVTVTDSAGNKDHIGDSFFWADELKKHFGVK